MTGEHDGSTESDRTPAHLLPTSTRAPRGAQRRSVRTRGVLASVAASMAASVAISSTPAIAGADPAAEPSAPVVADLSWGSCPELVNSPEARCTTVEVPTDYRNPDGGQIELTVSKFPARNAAARRGVLFGNSGGPGGESLGYFADNDLVTWPHELRDEWDLIGVQPRGLPYGTPLRCAPLDPGDKVTAAFNSGGAQRAACDAVSPGYGQHITTENTARDWEQVRRALGEERISIHGLSYGTYLGATYATLFPTHTDKMVMDSALHPDWAWNEALNQQKEPYKQRTYEMFQWLADHDAVYHQGTTALQVYQNWSARIVAESGLNPTLAPPPAAVGDAPPAWSSLAEQYATGATLTGPIAVQAENLFRALTNPAAMGQIAPTLAITRSVTPQSQLWPVVGEMLRDGTPSSDPTPTEPDVPDDALIAQTMQLTILCNENQVPPRPIDYPAFLWNAFVTGGLYDIAPLAFSSGAACAGAAPVTQPIPVTGESLVTPPLVINSVGDPQTPLTGAHAMANRMGAMFMTVGGGDHGQVGKGNPAVDNAVIDYLRTGHTDTTEAPAPPGAEVGAGPQVQ